MTPQERALVSELFDRLVRLESQPRDPEAERAVIEGLRRAPSAAYALVQTALVQDEALKRADARIQALEARLGDAPADRPTGFLDGMRDALLGRRESPRGSVPSVRPAREQPQEPSAAYAPGATAWRPGPTAPGGSFLGTAASAAAGVIGGALLLDGIRSMMGPGHGAFGIADPVFGADREPGSPWDGSAGGDLARQAGIDDIGRDTHTGGGGSGFGLFDDASAADGADAQADQDLSAFDDSGSDFGGGDFGSSDV
jgi:hypothetical protein